MNRTPRGVDNSRWPGRLTHTAEAAAKFERHIERFLSTTAGRRLANFTIQMALYSPAFTPAWRSTLEDRGYICRDLDDFAAYLAPPKLPLFETGA